MQLTRIFRYISIAIIISLLTACSSSLVRNDAVSTPGTIYNGPVNGVIIDFSDEVQAKLETIDSFDMINFKDTVINALDAKDLFSASSDKTLEILIKSVSAEPRTSAVISNIDSETAHIKGILIIKNKSEQIIGQHNISAEYTQGKFSDKQDKVHPDGLYTQFASLTTQTLTGKVSEKNAVANDAKNSNLAISDAKEESKNRYLHAIRIFLILASFVVGYSAAI